MRKFRIGFIGTGMRTVFIMTEMLRREEFEIVAISDISQDSMDMVSKKFDRVWDRYLDYRMLLKRDDIDAVVIGSPDYVHEEQAVAAFEAGKHVFLEKPIAVSLEGAERVLHKRDESGKTLLIGFVLRYNKLYKKMKKIIDSGMIGEVKTGWVLHSVGNGSDWYFHDWHGTMKNTSGLLLQKGSHDFDIINWVVNSKAKKIAAFGSRDFFGGSKPDDLTCQECSERTNCSESFREAVLTLKKPDGKPFAVQHNIWRNKCAFRNEVDVPDNHQVLIQYENGVKVSYMECHYTPDDNREYIFIGTRGKLKMDNARDTITVQLRYGMNDRREVITYSNFQSVEGHGGGDRYILDDFSMALSTGLQPNAGGEAGLEAIRIGLTAHKAINSDGLIII